MTDLFLYDTMSREKRLFVPADPARVTLYVCGPTVYNFAHIGNFRPVVVFDLLFRMLRHIYGEEAVGKVAAKASYFRLQKFRNRSCMAWSMRSVVHSRGAR